MKLIKIYARRFLFICNLLILVSVAWLGEIGSTFAMQSEGSAPAQSSPTTTKQGPLTDDQLWMFSSGAISASGYTVKPIENPNSGAVGYVVPERPHNPQDLPTFSNEGPMNNDSGANLQYETTVAVHPDNGNIVVGGAVDFQYTPRCTAVYASSNGGGSWSNSCPPSYVQVQRGDPAMAWSPDGSFAYYEALKAYESAENPFKLLFWRSSNNGQTFEELLGINDAATANDRPYIWVDHTSGTRRGTLYTTFTAFDPAGSGETNNIAVRNSANQGSSWSNTGYAATNNVKGSNYLFQFAALAPLPSGRIVVVWLEDPAPTNPNIQYINWARSGDGGATFPTRGTIANIPNDRRIPFGSTLPNKRFRNSAAPNIAADPFSGKLYAVWAAYRQPGQPYGTQAGIYLSTSENEGNSWSTPVLINPSTPQDQFLPWVTVGPDRRVHVTWGDSRNDPNNQRYDWYYATSTNNGVSFDGPARMSSASSDGSVEPELQPLIGDYAPVYAINGTLYATWTDTRDYSTRRNDAYAIRGSYTCPNPANYNIDDSQSGSMHMGGQLVGDNCGRCLVPVELPFPVTLYDRTFGPSDTILASSEGTLQFGSSTLSTGNTCLPAAGFSYTIFPYWGDMSTNNDPNSGVVYCPDRDCGVYVNTTGSAPYRTFHVRWKACQFAHSAGSGDPKEPVPGEEGVACGSKGPNHDVVNFEVQLFEEQTTFEIRYGYTGGLEGEETTIGVQKDNSLYSVFSCGDRLTSNRLIFTICSMPAPAPTNTPAPTFTPTNTSTPLPSPTRVSGCGTFQDVLPDNVFYPYIRCLGCRNIVSGYEGAGGTNPCTGQPEITGYPYFRDCNPIIRGQTAKMVSNAAGFTESVPTTRQSFEDVLPPSPEREGHPFWLWIERLAGRGIINGYQCGSVPHEPCGPLNRPYFRPWADVTRGQLSKIVSNARQYSESIPTGQQTFSDVPPSDTFYKFIERLASRGIINGYECGRPGELCDPLRRPYFRPYNNSTRGQTSKIVARAFFPECNPISTPTPPSGGEPPPPLPVETVPPPVPTSGPRALPQP